MRIVNFSKIRVLANFMLFAALTAVPLYGQMPGPTPVQICPTSDSITFYRCTYKTAEGVEAEHEPPVGGGAGSIFFDIPDQYVEVEKRGKMAFYSSDKYRKYRLARVQEPDHQYEAIANVLVMTEEAYSAAVGEITLFKYGLDKTQHGRLKLWLTTDDNKPLPDEPDIVILADGEGGAILSKKKIKYAATRKSFRSERYVRSKKNHRRVVKWELVQVIDGREQTIDTFSDARADSYYFYVTFHHPEGHGRRPVTVR